MQLAHFEHKLNNEFAQEIIASNQLTKHYSRKGTLIMPTDDGHVEEQCTILGNGTPYLTVVLWNPTNFIVEKFNPYVDSGKLLMTVDAETGAVLRYDETHYDFDPKCRNLRSIFGTEEDKARPYIRYHN